MFSCMIFRFLLVVYVSLTTQDPQNDVLSIAETRTLVTNISTVITDQLETAKTGVSQLYETPQQYLTPYFTYQILSPNDFNQQLEDCYLSPGFLLYNPALINEALQSFPREFYIANFNTEMLLSKTPEQFVTALTQATQNNECAIVLNTGTTYQIKEGECSRELESVCITPVTDFSKTQYSTILVPQLKQDMQPAIDITIETLSYLHEYLAISKPFIDDIGRKLKTIGELSTEFVQEIQNETATVAHFFKIIIIRNITYNF